MLEGDVPSPKIRRQVAAFTRVVRSIDKCREVAPELVEIKPNHFAACIRIVPNSRTFETVAPGDAPGLVQL
jgi:hypothetical protein